MKKGLWTYLLLALTALKILGAVVGFAGTWGAIPETGEPTVLSSGILCLVMLAFAAVGLFLLTSGRSDDRALDLGAFFFVLATPFANRPLQVMTTGAPPAWAWPSLVLSVANPRPNDLLPHGKYVQRPHHLPEMAHARQNGKRLGRPATAARHVSEIRKLHRAGVSKSEIARRIKIGRTSVRRILSPKKS